MKRAAMTAMGLLLCAGLAGAGEMVSYKSGADTVSGYLARPQGKGPFPGVIVILLARLNFASRKLPEPGMKSLRSTASQQSSLADDRCCDDQRHLI